MSKIYPFKFLDSYSKDDTKLFFGRDEEIDTLYKMIFQSNIIVLYGASGTGKSSLIQCGLAGRFQPHDWLSLFVRRGDDLNISLEKVLKDAEAQSPASEETIDFSELHADDEPSNTAEAEQSPLTKSLKAVYLNSFRPIYLIFDQFEELFILGKREEQLKFIQSVQSLLKLDQPVKMIFSIREEYLGYLDEFEKAVPQLMNKKLRIEPMNLEKVRQVILGVTSFEDSNISLKKGEEKKIAESIFSKIKGNDKTLSIQLPYLQVFMDKLYMETTHDESRQADAVFSMDTINRMGNIDDVLKDFLEEQVVKTSQKLSGSRRKVSTDDIWKILSPLATLEGTKDPLTLQALYERLHGIDKDLIRDTINAFVVCRIMRCSEAGNIYELAHDTLAKKVADHRSENEIELLEVKKLIKNQASQKAQERELFSQRQLGRIEPLLSRLVLSGDEKKLVIDSQNEIQRQKELAKRHTRITYTIMTIVIVLLSGLAFWAIKQSSVAAMKTKKVQLIALRSQAFTEIYKNHDFTKGFRYAQYAYLKDSNNVKTQAILYKAYFQPMDSQDHYFYKTKITFKSLMLFGSSSPDGKSVITTSGNTATIRDAQTEKILTTLAGHTGTVNSAVFSPDGQQVLTASDDNTARVWDGKTGKQLAELKGHTGRVSSAVFSSDGKNVVTASDDSTARIWDAQTGQELQTLTEHKALIRSAAFSADGERIVTTSGDNRAQVWEAGNDKPIVILGKKEDYFYSAVFSPDGSKIATASRKCSAKIWDAETGAELFMLKGHQGKLNSVRFSADGRRLITSSVDRTAKIWDVATGKEIITLTGSVKEVKLAYFREIDSTVVTESSDSSMRVWEAKDGRELMTVAAHSMALNSVSFSPDGKRYITASEDTTAIIRDLATGKLLVTLHEHHACVNSACFSHDGTMVATAAGDRTAKIWDAKTGKVLHTLVGHTDSNLGHISFSPDDKKLVTGGADSTARIWDVATGKLLETLRGHKDLIISAFFTSDGNKVITGSQDSTVVVWDAKTGKKISKLIKCRFAINFAALSPDNKKIGVVTTDATATIFDAVTGKELVSLVGHTDALFRIVFSADGKRVITSSLDRTAKIWDVTTGIELATLPGHTNTVEYAVFSPDGRTVLTASDDKTVKVWNVYIPSIIKDMDDKIDDISDEEKAKYGIIEED